MRAERSDFIRLELILEDAAQTIAAGDQAGFARLDEEFHRALVQASHDHLLIRLFDFTGVAALGTESANPSGRDDDLATRRAQVNALRAHDTAAVAAILAADTGKIPRTES